MSKTDQIPIVDLFAGPGGLSEGFSAFQNPDTCFRICISIEKDDAAHNTLLLRSFYRQFKKALVPDAYYEFLKSQPFCKDNLLSLLNNYKKEGLSARNEALCLELGRNNKIINQRIPEAIIDCLNYNKPWVLIGGPPCQAYSLAGRVRNQAKKGWSLENDDRSELYQEYLNILAKFQPAVFIMENVKGMLSAKMEGLRLIDRITEDLKYPYSNKHQPLSGKRYHYKLYSLTKKHQPDETFEPEDFLIKSEHYGIPQCRHRVIIMGIREDCDTGGQFNILQPQNDYVSVKNTIFDLPALYARISDKTGHHSELDDELKKLHDWKLLLKEYFLRKQADDPNVQYTIQTYLDKLGNQQGRKPDIINKHWFHNKRLGDYVCNHEARSHMRSDLIRYYYVCCYGKTYSVSPTLDNFPASLLPAHKNAKSGNFADRFRVQLENEPATTITCHISKDGHYYIHPDPRQCRSLSVREAARIQTFPDDYFFCGNRTQQYQQVGNAVPPLLARQIAAVVWQIIHQSGKL